MKQAAFIAVTTEHPLYEHYQDIPENVRQTIIPVTLMFNRWDGSIGFPGGNIDSDESPLQAAIRELEEEVGVILSDTLKKEVHYVCTHGNEKIQVHFHSLQVDFMTFKQMMHGSHKADHFMVEGTPIVPQCMNYPNGKGFNAFIKNNFAFAVKEEIAELIQYLGWDTKYNLTVEGINPQLLQQSVNSTEGMDY